MKALATLLSLPALALAQTGEPPAATGVQVYGVVDAGVVAERGCKEACANLRLSPGISEGSRIGISGREPLAGSGTAAVFTLEGGIENDTGRSEDGRLLGRQAWVGLDGPWGVLTLGRQYNLQYEALVEVADPFHGGLSGAATNLMGYTAKRYDNAVRYRTRSGRGWSASAIYSFGESEFSTTRNRAYGATLGYENGMFNIRIAHQRKRNPIEAVGTTQPVDLSARNTLVAANLNLGAATAFAAYGVNRGLGSSPWDPANPYGALLLSTPSMYSHDMLAGLSYTSGRAIYMVSLVHKDDRSPLKHDADQAAVGLMYSFSRRTAVYASFANIHNRNGAPYTAGNASERGKGNRALTLGLRHAF
ncbi:porin [Pseudoduganella violaceinigra]|uniref:porin n=1 Tax=Pseudoduganella violaceinigra TaxID=246602 RepID=UPI000414BB9B|nr:porin [Pseudoduganella violaceinigra]